MNRQRFWGTVILVVCLTVSLAVVWAVKNACGKCGKQAELTDLVCKECAKPLNLCLACGTQNPVANDYCLKCGEMLAEMRVLATIDPEVREELRLGQSDRAQLERELAKIDNQLNTEPEKAEMYLYRQAKIYKRMNFYAREAKAWEEFLVKFPASTRKNRVKAFQSEALRQWGFLFYQQGELKNALGKFQEAVTANPLNAEAWQWIGRLKNEAKDPKGATEAYLNALKAQPGDKTSMHFLRVLKQPIPKELRKPVAPLMKAQEAPDEKPDVPANPVATAKPPVAVPASPTMTTTPTTLPTTATATPTTATTTTTPAPTVVPASTTAVTPAPTVSVADPVGASPTVILVAPTTPVPTSKPVTPGAASESGNVPEPSKIPEPTTSAEPVKATESLSAPPSKTDKPADPQPVGVKPVDEPQKVVIPTDSVNGGEASDLAIDANEPAVADVASDTQTP